MSKVEVVDPFDYVVFGGTGDLSMRKIYPALFHRECEGQLPEDAGILAVARSEFSREEFCARVEASCRDKVGSDSLEGEAWQRFVSRLNYSRVDALTPDGYAEMEQFLAPRDQRIRIFYLATAPSLYGTIAQNLRSSGLADETSRVVLEKPIGHDLESSEAINQEVGRHFTEHQIYRIDHYLGKETVQNLLALRFGNILFESIWSSAVVDHVQITTAETVGLEGRAAYYEHSGALRDMVQNHLLQLLCLVAMESPYSISADPVRDEKLKVLKSLRPLSPETVDRYVVRGQYGEGAIQGESVTSYVSELGEPSKTETFVALKAYIDNWRWAGVPFYLRTGKRMKRRHSEIVIVFRDIPHSAFPDNSGLIKPNRLIIRLQPDEGVGLQLMTKVPGHGGIRLNEAALDLSFADEFPTRYPDSYERLLLDVVRGDSTLFMRRDEVEAAWRWVTPILEVWAESEKTPKAYTAGSWGPTASATLIDRDGHSWHEDMD